MIHIVKKIMVINTWLLLIIVLAAFGFVIYYFPYFTSFPGSSMSPSTSSDRFHNPDWSIAAGTAGLTFEYPRDLSFQYIYKVDWPPQLQVLNEAFACTEAGSETAPAGKTEKHTVGNRIYCVTKETQGAAGSIYTMYAYAFPKDNKTVIFTFSLRFVQCGNFNDSEKSVCENERASFTIDPLVDQMARSIAY